MISIIKKDHTVTAERLKMAMELKEMRAVDLAARTGIGKSSISQYMSAQHWPDDSIKVGKMAKALGVDPAWLMGFDVPMQPKNNDSDGNSQQQEYYNNKETSRIAQQIFDDPDLHALFDAARDSKPEDMKMAADLLRRLKGTNPDA